MGDAAKTIKINDLPLTFQAKYLGSCKAMGAFGVKYIRKPVDLLVESVKSSRKNLSPVEIKVVSNGLEITQILKDHDNVTVGYQIETITYGVQDVNFPKIFCFIITKPEARESERHLLHAFLCPSKQDSRKITFALGAAFKHLAEMMNSKAAEQKLKQVIQLNTQDDDNDSEAEA